MRTKKAIAVAITALALCSSTAFGVAAMAEGTEATYQYTPLGNVVANYSFETDAAEYSPLECTNTVSSDFAYDGVNSLKLSGRTAAYQSFNTDIASSNFVQDVLYEYSFYVYSVDGCDVMAGWSPWGVNAAGQYVWEYGGGSWTGAKAGEWTKVSSIFMYTMIDGQLVMKTPNGEGGFNFIPATAHNDTGDDCARFDIIRFSVQATATAEFYVDFVTVAPYVQNQIPNYGFEQDINGGYKAADATLEQSADVAYEGTKSMKISDRIGHWSSYNYDVKGLAFDQWYDYSFYAYSETATQVTAAWSPWALNEAGAWMWVYGNGPWTDVPAATWTRVSSVFKMTLVDGKMNVVTPNGEGGYNYFAVKPADGDDTFVSLDNFRVNFNAPKDLESLYIDLVTLVPTTVETEGGGDEGEYTGPTGFGNGENTAFVPGNMMQNASFDNDMFNSNYINTGTWFIVKDASTERVKQNNVYSQDGAEDGYGSCAEVYDREVALTWFQSRSLNIWASNQYTVSGYISAKEATKGALNVRMWAYYDHDNDETTENQYPCADYTLPFVEVVPDEWVYYEVTFGWVFEVTDEENQTGILTLQIYDGNEEGAEVVEELSCSVSHGLSAFAFMYKTDETDANYLTDLYFDNFSLFNVTAKITPPEDGGDEGGGDIVIPGGGDEGGDGNGNEGDGNEGDGDKKEENKKGGCGSSIYATSILAMLTLAGAALLKKKRD